MTQLGLEPRPLIIGHWVSHPGLRVVNEFSWHSYHNNVNWRHDYSNSDNDNDDESKINNNKNYRYDTIFFQMIWCSEINLRTNYHHCLKYIYLSSKKKKKNIQFKLTERSDFIGIHSSNYYSIVPGWLPSFCCGTMKLKKEFLKIRWGQFITLTNALWVNMFS